MSKIVKYFDNLIEIKNIPNRFIRFKLYEYILQTFKLNKCIIKYYDQEFLIYNESDLKNCKKFVCV